MNQKISKQQVQQAALASSLLLIAVVIAVVGAIQLWQREKQEQAELEPQISAYREMIGTSMDVKRAELVMFNTEQECREFIAEHGGAPHPASLGIGIVPMMEEAEDGAYYNVVGNALLEQIYDGLQDGAYTTEPFELSGMFCYLKRIGNYSPLTDEYIRELIKNERKEEQP